jgi:hypothetical protein
VKNEENNFKRNMRLLESVGKSMREREMGGICEILRNPLLIFNTPTHARDDKALSDGSEV